MMIKKNEKGLGTYEILSMVLVCLVLATIIWLFAIRTSYNEKYRVFRYNAKLVALNATGINNYEQDGSVSLLELITENYFGSIKNPFIGEKFCDMYESKIRFKDSIRYVTLQCGNYLIDNQNIGETSYKIYQVTSWQEQEMKDFGRHVDTTITYNYEKKDKTAYAKYYNETAFLYIFNKENNTEYNSIKEIEKDYNVLRKRVYRTKRLVKEIELS